MLIMNGYWLGGRDSNPDTVVQSHVSYRWTTSQYRLRRARRRELPSIATPNLDQQAPLPELDPAVSSNAARLSHLLVADHRLARRLLAGRRVIAILLAAVAGHPALPTGLTSFVARPLV